MVSDSQSTCGAQRRRVKFFWRVVVVLVCTVVGLFWYSFNEALHANDSEPIDGHLPLEKRVSIEAFQRDVEPQGYVLALDSMSKDGRHVFVWRDYDNGGTVDVNINGDWTSFAYESGARPSDGSVPDPRVLIPNDSRDIAGYVSDSLPSVRYLDGDAPEFPETDGSEWAEKRQSIEVFQRDVEPGILRFRDEIVGDSPYDVARSSPS